MNRQSRLHKLRAFALPLAVALSAFTACTKANVQTSGASSTSTTTTTTSTTYFAFSWLSQLGQTATSSSVQSTAVDTTGNIYVSGYTSANLASCGGVSASCSGSPYGTQDYFVAKYDSSGTLVWLSQLGETGKISTANAVAVDDAGDVYVGGHTNGNLAACAGTGGACGGGASKGSNDYFVSKYSNAGVWQWTVQLGEAAKNAQTFGVGVDSTSNVYVSGYTTGNLVSCGGVSANCAGSAQGSRDAFVSKYDSTGAWQWTKQLGETGYLTNVTGLAVDSSGNSYLTGKTVGGLYNCSGVSGACGGATAQGTADVFTIKYDTNGTWKWTAQLGETGKTVGGQQVTTDSFGNVYVTGYTTANLESCSGVSASCSGSSYGSQDWFLIKYDSSGTWKWTKQMGVSTYSATGKSVAIDSHGNLYVGGVTTSNLANCDVGTHTCSPSAASQGTQDYFISRFDSSGTWVSTQQLGSSAHSTTLQAIAVNSSGEIAAGGFTDANLESCSGVSSSCSGASTSSQDLFVTRY